MVNMVAYGHFHHHSTGRVFYHAHPYDAGSETHSARPSHAHSEQSLLIIEFITYLFASTLVVWMVFHVLLDSFFFSVFPLQAHKRNISLFFLPLHRAPPLV
jgi:hypothetical protein